MKFVVEALGLTTGGGKQLALDLISHLAYHTDHEFVLLLPDLPGYPEAANLRRIACRVPRSLSVRYRFLNHSVPRICAQQGANALLCLGNLAPRRSPCPTVVLLHNAYLVCREPVAERRQAVRQRLQLMCSRVLLRSLVPQTRVIVQTEVMKRHMLAQRRLPAGNVSIIPNGHSVSQDAGHNVPVERPAESPFTFL
jgi:hypothetical protein